MLTDFQNSFTGRLTGKFATGAAAAVDPRDRQTDGRTLDRFMTLTAYCADRVTSK